MIIEIALGIVLGAVLIYLGLGLLGFCAGVAEANRERRAYRAYEREQRAVLKQETDRWRWEQQAAKSRVLAGCLHDPSRPSPVFCIVSIFVVLFMPLILLAWLR